MQGAYFTKRLRAADSVLELIQERFDLEHSHDIKEIYYWILDIERKVDVIGRQFYSRIGKTTLIGILNRERIWLRANIYANERLTREDLIDSNGRLKPQHVGNRVVNFEKLLADIARETRVLRELFNQFAEKEVRLIKEFKQTAKVKISNL